MLAKRPKIFRNMDEETQTEIGEENNKELKNKTEADDTEKDNVQEKLFNSHRIPIDEHKIMCCEIHPDKIVEYYCRIHGALPCSRCAIENHRKCQGMVIIEDIAQSAKAKGEVVKVSQKLDTAAAQIEAQRQSDKKVLTNLDESIENINKELKHHRDKICTIAESIETRLTKRSRKIYKERSGFVTGHLDTCNIVGVQVERLRQVMERIMASENEAEKFVMLQKVKKTLQFLNTPLHNLQREAIDVQMYLTLNVDLDKTLEHIDKRMLIEVKTSKRGDVGPKQSSVKDKKSILKSQLNLYESKSNKSSTNKVSPHKFLAQRNFKPYKVRPYTVEKKPAVKTPFKSFGSLASVRNTRPVIVLSGENINSSSQINKASTVSRNIANKPVKGHETPDTLIDRKVIEVEVTRHNKNVDGQAKSSKYTWGAQADKQPAGGVKSVHTTSTNTVPSKSTRYSAKNYKFVLPSYDKKLASEQNRSNDSPTGLSKGRRPLYRKEKMANEQTDDQYKNKSISDRSKQDRRKIIPSPHRMYPKSKVVFADTGVPGKSSDREVETHSTVKDANSNSNGTTIRVKVNMSNNGVVQENQGTDNSKKGNGPVSPIKNNVHSNASLNNVIADNKIKPKVPNGDLSNGRPKSKTPEKQTDIGLNKQNFEDTSHDTKMKKSEENQNVILKNQIPSTVHPDKNKNDVDPVPEKADSNGNQNKTTNQPGKLDENVKHESHNNEKNQTAENPANKDSINGECVMKEKSKEEISQIQSNDNRNVSTSSPNDNQAHSESNVKASNVKDDKNNPVKAFVTDISTISEGPTISEKSIERLIKSRSADRLRLRKSGSSLLRAKSDK